MTIFLVNRMCTYSLISLLLIADIPVLYAEDFNTEFVHGVSHIPSILNSKNTLPEGRYYVDVYQDKKRLSRTILNISEQEELQGVLCLRSDWLDEVGLAFRKDAYKDYYNADQDCYALGKEINTEVNFNYGQQTLSVALPQAYQLSESDASRWDYGVNGARFRYNGNFDKGSNTDMRAFGSTDLKFNIERWILESDANVLMQEGKGSNLNVNRVTLSTPVSSIKADFQVGKAQTHSEIFSDFSFYGVNLRSNSNMTPWAMRGYAPLISGSATTTSRITVTQNGVILMSRMVNPGPYLINDLTPIGNGELVVTVEDSQGNKIRKNYPVSTLPTLMRPGSINFNIAVGTKNNANRPNALFTQNKDYFTLGSIDYGFERITLNTASVIHKHYKGIGAGVTNTLGEYGAIYSGLNVSYAEYKNWNSEGGISTMIKYAKSIGNETNIQLLAYRYQGGRYNDFSDFDYNKNALLPQRKVRYEGVISHNVMDGMYVSSSFWLQSYRGKPRKESGVSLMASKSVLNDASLSLMANYSNGLHGRNDYTSSVNITIPFDFSGSKHYGSGGVSFAHNGESYANSGVSGSLSERLNYGLGTMIGKHDTQSSVNIGYAFDTVQSNISLTKNRFDTYTSGNISGSVIATQPTGVLFTKEAMDTVAVVKVKGKDGGISGIAFNNSMPSNSNGETALNLNSYSRNTINMDVTSISDDTEFKTTSMSVVPTHGAIIYREFGYEKVNRYIIRVKDKDNLFITTGGNAFTNNGKYAGFVDENGILLVTLPDQNDTLKVIYDNSKSCQINMTNIKSNINSVHEVRCD